MSEPLRVGLIVDSSTIKGWQFSIVEKLLARENCELVAVVENYRQKDRLLFEVSRRLLTMSWLFVDRIERWLSLFFFGRHWKSHDYTVDENLPLSQLGGTYKYFLLSDLESDNRAEHQFNEEDREVFEAMKIDVLLDFGSNSIKGSILGVARFGAWSFQHSQCTGFWEVFESQHFTRVSIRILAEDDDKSIVVRKGIYSTFSYSWNENRRRLLWRSRFLMLDALDELMTIGIIPDRSAEPPSVFGLNWHGVSAVPGPLIALRACAKLWWRITLRALERLVLRRQWQLLLCRGAPQGRSVHEFESVVPPAGRFWADPFLVKDGDATWMFFEDFSFRRKKARISCVRITEDGYEDFQEALNRPYHLSYPFMFAYGGGLYMIPETCQNKTVELWKCVEFPHRWTKQQTIFQNVSAVDATILEHDGRWWMFVSLDRTGLGHDGSELFIYHAENPVRGNWEPHAANPVLVDARHARMAGGFIHTTCGRLIRCGQKRGSTYGRGLAFLEVVKLTTAVYEERKVEDIGPGWRPDVVGIHHCHQISDLTALDMCVRTFRFQGSTRFWRKSL